MNRREVLASTGIALSTLVSGCVSETESPDTGTSEAGETETDSETATGNDSESTADTENTDVADSEIVLRNIASTEKMGGLLLSMDTETIFETEFKVSSGERQSLDPGITETGQYELTAAIEAGAEASFPFSVGEYDLRAGSNLIVEIDADEIMILMEE
jgi:hypothetical protein